jgi:hypothetical protein
MALSMFYRFRQSSIIAIIVAQASIGLNVGVDAFVTVSVEF